MNKDEKNIEKAKRLQPKLDVLRELFLKSGNLCAFPNCSHVIMSKDGLMVGEICHIEAAEEGGERFNIDQSNEDRRAFSNLLLMCHDHHVETNDVSKFDVDRMKEIKALHEAKVSNFIEKTLLTVMDHTKLNNPRVSGNCIRFGKALGLNLTEGELKETAKCLNALLEELSKLPLPARNLFVVIIERSRQDECRHDTVLVSEIQMACSLENQEMSSLCAILEKYGLVYGGIEDDYGNPQIHINKLDGWNVWQDVRAFVKGGHATLQELIVGLNFGLFDEPAEGKGDIMK